MDIIEQEVCPHRAKKEKHVFRSIITVNIPWHEGKIDNWRRWHSNLESARMYIEKQRKLINVDFVSYQIVDKNKNLVESG